jgi:hypothetical protein
MLALSTPASWCQERTPEGLRADSCPPARSKHQLLSWDVSQWSRPPPVSPADAPDCGGEGRQPFWACLASLRNGVPSVCGQALTTEPQPQVFQGSSEGGQRKWSFSSTARTSRVAHPSALWQCVSFHGCAQTFWWIVICPLEIVSPQLHPCKCIRPCISQVSLETTCVRSPVLSSVSPPSIRTKAQCTSQRLHLESSAFPARGHRFCHYLRKHIVILPLFCSKKW